jgi:DNA-binding XRE family transcriptional regulator
MEFEGRIWQSKKSKYWIAHIEGLDLSTQGTSEKNAMAMVKDAIESLVQRKGFHVTVSPGSNGTFSVGGNNSKAWIGFLFQRLRIRSGFTIEQVARRMGSTSKTTYARYEQGKVMPSLERFSEILEILTPRHRAILRLAA